MQRPWVGSTGHKHRWRSQVEAVAVVAAPTCNPGTWRLRLKNYCDFRGSLIYSDCKLVFAPMWDPVSKSHHHHQSLAAPEQPHLAVHVSPRMLVPAFEAQGHPQLIVNMRPAWDNETVFQETKEKIHCVHVTTATDPVFNAKLHLESIK